MKTTLPPEVAAQYESTHTPGPWVVGPGAPRRDTGTVSIDTVSGDWLGLAEVVVLMDDGEKSPDGAANARLIAAAPELLSALRMMTPEDHAKGASVCAVYARTGPCDCGVTQARAAIAKATGGES